MGLTPEALAPSEPRGGPALAPKSRRRRTKPSEGAGAGVSEDPLPEGLHLHGGSG